MNVLAPTSISTKEWAQADRLDNVVLAVRAVSKGKHSDKSIGEALGDSRRKPYGARQGRYYRKASEILGFTKRIRTNVSILTTLGRRLIRTNEAGEREILVNAVLQRDQIIQTVLGVLSASNGKVSRSELYEAIRSLVSTTDKMVDRRLDTTISWLDYLKLVRKVDNTLILLSAPSSLNKVEISDSKVPVLPRLGETKLFKEVNRRRRNAADLIRYEVNAARLERARITHERLTALLAKRIRLCNALPTFNNLVDLAARVENQDFIIEVKSAGRRVIEQVHKAVSQLYWYRYLEALADAKLVLLIEKPLSPELIDYIVKDRGIYVIWDAANEELFTTEKGKTDLPFMR